MSAEKQEHRTNRRRRRDRQRGEPVDGWQRERSRQRVQGKVGWEVRTDLRTGTQLLLVRLPSPRYRLDQTIVDRTSLRRAGLLVSGLSDGSGRAMARSMEVSGASITRPASNPHRPRPSPNCLLSFLRVHVLCPHEQIRALTWSKVTTLGLNPPCTQNTLPSTTAPRLR